MWTRKDQLQAYQFLRRRLISAHVLRSANAAESPSKRWIVACVTGACLMLLGLVGFAIYGAFTGGPSKSWKNGGSLIVEKETGALFVLDSKQTLRPVLNYASGALFLGSDRPKVDQVSAKSLQEQPRGTSIGIPGAPQSVPAKGALIAGPWIACSRTVLDQGGSPRPEVVLKIGGAEVGTPPAATDGLLVTEPITGDRYVVQEDRAFRVASPEVSRALGYAGAPDIPVGTGWLNVMPRGGDLDFIAVPGAGDRGPDLSGESSVVGSVYVVRRDGAADEYLVMLADGLSAVNETEAELILAAPGNPAPTPDGRAITLPASAVAAAESSSERIGIDVPARLATPLASTGSSLVVCASIPGTGEATVRVSVAESMESATRDSSIPIGGNDVGGPLADVVSVRPGRACLTTESVSAGGGLGTTYLVTDEGRRYPIERATAKVFGYPESTKNRVPKAFLSLLPLGPPLSPTAAATPVDPAQPIAEPAR
ncbi:MAG: type VII secretion protein EccB [Nocardioides sp.]